MDIIFSTYLSKPNGFAQHDSSGKCKANDYRLMARWYETLNKHKLNGIIFHNELSEKFCKKYTRPNFQFVLYIKEHRPSYNDERFYCYRWYMDKCPDIQRVICTDLFDVEFHGNPFTLFKPEYDLYCGSEVGSYKNTWLIQKMQQLKLQPIKPPETIYNGGIWGGYRGPFIRFLDGMIELLDKAPKNNNANTPLYLHYLNRIWKGTIFTGHPLHNRFRSNEVGGAIIKHK